MSKPEAQKFLNQYLSTMGAAAATAGAGVGSAVAVDRLMHTDEDHAGEKIIVVKQSYAKNPDAASAISYIYGEKGVGSPMDQNQVAKALSGTSTTNNSYLKATRPDVLERIEHVAAKRPDLIPLLARNETVISRANIQAIDGNPESGLQEAYTSQGVNEAVPAMASLAAGVGTYALADKYGRR